MIGPWTHQSVGTSGEYVDTLVQGHIGLTPNMGMCVPGCKKSTPPHTPHSMCGTDCVLLNCSLWCLAHLVERKSWSVFERLSSNLCKMLFLRAVGSLFCFRGCDTHLFYQKCFILLCSRAQILFIHCLRSKIFSPQIPECMYICVEFTQCFLSFFINGLLLLMTCF